MLLHFGLAAPAPTTLDEMRSWGPCLERLTHPLFPFEYNMQDFSPEWKTHDSNCQFRPLFSSLPSLILPFAAKWQTLAGLLPRSGRMQARAFMLLLRDANRVDNAAGRLLNFHLENKFIAGINWVRPLSVTTWTSRRVSDIQKMRARKH